MRSSDGTPAFLSPEQVAYRYYETDSSEGLAGFDQLFRLFRIVGPIDLEALDIALTRTVEGITALRCRIEGRVARRMVASLEQPVLESHEGLTSRQFLQGLLSREYKDEDGCRLRAAVCGQGDGVTLLALSVDHFFVDPIGFEMVLRRLETEYFRAELGVGPLPAENDDYLGYATWQASNRRGARDRAGRMIDRLSAVAGCNGWLAGRLQSRDVTHVSRSVAGVDFRRFEAKVGALGSTRFVTCVLALASSIAVSSNADKCGDLEPHGMVIASVASRRPRTHQACVGLFAQMIFLEVADTSLTASACRQVERSLGAALSDLPYAFDRVYSHPRGPSLVGGGLAPRVMVHYFDEAAEFSLAGCEVERIDDEVISANPGSMADLHLLVFDRGDQLDLELRARDRAWSFASPETVIEAVVTALTS